MRSDGDRFRLRLVGGDKTLTIDDCLLDVVIFDHVIEHVPDRTRPLRVGRHVLKPADLVSPATPDRSWGSAAAECGVEITHHADRCSSEPDGHPPLRILSGSWRDPGAQAMASSRCGIKYDIGRLLAGLCVFS